MVDVSGSSSRLRPCAGIALGPILMLLAFVAIIAAVIASGAGSFNGNTPSEAGKIQAHAIIQEAEQLQAALRKIYIDNACSSSQINFQNNNITNYTNPTSPVDGSCNIFDARGGGIVFPTIQASMLETDDGGRFVFNAASTVKGQGSWNSGSSAVASLTGYLPIDSLYTCQSINKAVGILGVPYGWYDGPTDWKGHFNGVYASASTYNNPYNNGVQMGIVSQIGGDGGVWPANGAPMMGCAEEGVAGVPFSRPSYYFSPKIAPYFFYVILLVN